MRQMFSILLILQFSCPFAVSLTHNKLPALIGIIPGKTTKINIKTILGAPSRVTESKILKTPDSGDIWEYLSGGGVRLSVAFEKQADAVMGWSWTVLEGEPEQDLKTALNQFPGASWNPETVRWVNPHSLPMECFYKDKRMGVSIGYTKARKVVTSISWWAPSRLPLSEPSEKPPKFCIQDACVDGILATEFFKDDPPCKLPK